MEHIDAKTFDEGVVPSILGQLGTFMRDQLTAVANDILDTAKNLADIHPKKTLLALFVAGAATMSASANASDLNNAYSGVAAAGLAVNVMNMINGNEPTTKSLQQENMAGQIGTLVGGSVNQKNAGGAAAIAALGSNYLIKAVTPDPMKNAQQITLNGQRLLVNTQSGQVFDANSKQQVGTYDSRTNIIRDNYGNIQSERGNQQYSQPQYQQVQYQQANYQQPNAANQQLTQEFANVIGPKYNAAVKAYADGNNVQFQTNCNSAVIGMQRAAAVGVRFNNEYTQLMQMGCNVNTNSRNLLPN